MQDTIAHQSLTSLQRAVLETVAYSDVFEFPLMPDEVWRNLPIKAEQEAVAGAIRELLHLRVIDASGPYVTLPDRAHLAAHRDARRRSSTALRVTAERYGRWIARLPFVRMVALTGSLAVENAEADDDLDYLIVTARGRVWLTRAMTMVLVRIAALRGVTLCPNYLLSEDALSLPERDFYTARELQQMAPLFGEDVYTRMLAANAWWREHLPNAEPPSSPGRARKPSLLRKGAEWLLMSAPFDRLEAWILARKGAELRRNAGPEAVFNESMCKGHFEGWRERTRALVDERMARLTGVPR